MTVYSKNDLEKLTGEELMVILDKNDVVTGLSILGFMPFSSFTGLPYDNIGRNETKVVIGGVWYANRQRGYGPLSVEIVRKRSERLFLGKVIDS